MKHLFRRNFDLTRLRPRESVPSDIPGISLLLHHSVYHFLGVPFDDVATLLSHNPALLLTSGSDIWGAAFSGYCINSVTWLRGLVLADELPLEGGLDALLPPFHALLRARGVRTLFYAGEEAVDLWLQTQLRRRDYTTDTRVIVYETDQLSAPAHGNPAVHLRKVAPSDLPDVLALDNVCFAPQWCKDGILIEYAISHSPYFLVAELDGALVGYAFVTKHLNGQLIHLVRIAVHPAQQGRGIGIRLLAEVVAFAAASGASVLSLNTQEHNTRAQRLYHWFGFRRTGEQQQVLRREL